MFETILAPVDFSPDSEVALREAARLARALDARLVVLHAEPLDPPAYFAAGQIAREQPAYRKAAVTEIREFAVETLGDAGAAAEVRFADVEASESILGAAAELRHPLIVMATHGRTGLRSLLYGSTTERVMHGPFAVLAVLAHSPAGGGLVAAPSQPAEQLAALLEATPVNATDERSPSDLLARAKASNARFAFRGGATSA